MISGNLSCWSLFSEPNETTFMGTTLSLALFMNGKGNFLGETSQRLPTIDIFHAHLFHVLFIYWARIISNVCEIQYMKIIYEQRLNVNMKAIFAVMNTSKYRLEFFWGLIITTAQVMFITATIAFIYRIISVEQISINIKA